MRASLNLYGIIKAADNQEDKKKSIQDTKDALKKYRKDPTGVNQDAVVAALEHAEALHPNHINGGYFMDTRNAMDRAKTNFDSSNYLQGALNAASVPLHTMADLAMAPYRAIKRSINPALNVDYNTVADLKSADNLDPKHFNRAALEALKVVSSEPKRKKKK